MVAAIFILGCLALLAGYVWYGRRLAAWLGINRDRPTPAHELRDDVDFLPAHTPVLFGHHFSSIAGAGPIVGPVFASLWFGWGPTFLWVLVGAVFVGGVHDYAALVASIRHRGRSIGEICRNYLSPLTYRAFLVFIYFTLVYVLIVFLDLTAATFAPADLSHPERTHIGGAVATSSLIYVGIAVVFGFLYRKTKLSLKVATFIFVPLVFLALWIGDSLPIDPNNIPAIVYGHPRYTWSIILLVYCFAASVAPVWVLLQPRDYLSSFLLYGCLVGGTLGILLLGVSGQGQIHHTTFQWFRNPEMGTGFIFPMLFITVACGAVSGFHSIVASGTSSKQLSAESHAKPVAYGGMLVEGLLALIAVCAVMLLKPDDPLAGQHPVTVFASGMGRFLGAFGVPEHWGRVFGLLAVSTFLLTTLDTATRLARFILEELLNLPKGRSRYVSTAITIVLPAILVFMRVPNPAEAGGFLPVWRVVWPAFGTTNQLLAALTLLVVFTWLSHERRPRLFVALPMLFMLVTTFTGLTQLVAHSLFAGGGQKVVGVVCLVLLFLAALVAVDTAMNWKKITGA